GGAGGGGRADDRDDDDQQVLHQAQLDAEELRDEDRGDGRVDGGAAVHLRGGAQRYGERGVAAGDAEVALGDPLGEGQGADRRSADERQLNRGPCAGEVLL